MAYARVRLGLPLGGINREQPTRNPAPTQPTQYAVQDLQGFRYDSFRSLRPLPPTSQTAAIPTVDTDPTAGVANVADNGRVTRLHNIRWADGTADIVRHTRRAMCELSGGAWVQRTEPLGMGASTDNDYWGAALVPDAIDKRGRYLFSNRIVGPFVWSGTGNATAAPAGSLPCRHIAPFADRAILLNVLDGATIKGRTALWSVAGNGLLFAGTGSGNRDFLELDGEITGAAAIRRSFFVYSAKSIAGGVETFDPDAPITYSPVISSGIGNWAPNSLLTYNDIHAFLSEEGFKSFDGSQISHIGTAIDSYVLSRINRAAIDTVCGFVKPDWKIACWAIPVSGSITPNELWYFDFQRNTWHRFPITTSYYPQNPTAFTVVTVSDSPSWTGGSFGIPWDDPSLVGPPAIRWIDLGGEASAPTVHSGHALGMTRFMDESAPNTSIKILVETNDFTFEGSPVFEEGFGRPDSTTVIEPDDLITLEQVEIIYRTISGVGTLHFYVSGDGGQTYTAFGALTTSSTGVPLPVKNGDAIGRVRIQGRFTGSQLRLRITNQNLSTSVISSCAVFLEDVILTVRKAGKIRAIA